MSNDFSEIIFPELVIGIAGPIGIDIDRITSTLCDALARVSYKSVPIHITKEIMGEETNVPKPEEADFGTEINFKMSHASEICRKFASPDTLMRFAMKAIRRHRGDLNREDGIQVTDGELSLDDIARSSTAYIIRQLKRPEEVHLLRKVYGKQFILMSAYGSTEDRKRIIESSLKNGLPVDKPAHEISAIADQIIYRDQNEDDDGHGQHLSDTFHLADVFIDGNSRSDMQIMIRRFIEAFFGKADVAPSRSEYGMYAAKSASLRSSDLSRQVGAAIFTVDGELITQGCNEVPKAFGGTYWDGDEVDYRDIKIGKDPNDHLKKEIIRDLFERLLKHDLVSDSVRNIGPPSKIVECLTAKPTEGGHDGQGALRDAAVMDLTEYGRVVHAEMSAICDAARLGRSIKKSILYCTTFPCHNCTRAVSTRSDSTGIPIAALM